MSRVPWSSRRRPLALREIDLIERLDLNCSGLPSEPEPPLIGRSWHWLGSRARMAEKCPEVVILFPKTDIVHSRLTGDGKIYCSISCLRPGASDASRRIGLGP